MYFRVKVQKMSVKRQMMKKYEKKKDELSKRT